MRPTDEEQFLAAFDEYADALLRHASFRLSSRERALDLTQETFLKAWDYYRDGNEIRQWKGFLYRIMNNLIVDEYRKAKESSLDALLEDDEMPGMQVFIAAGSRAEKEAALDEAMLIEKVRALIPKLPAAYRDVVTLRYVDGHSPKEIADLLGITENTVSVRIHRAVAKLRELCEPFTP